MKRFSELDVWELLNELEEKLKEGMGRECHGIKISEIFDAFKEEKGLLDLS
jgi:hypothetical protein